MGAAGIIAAIEAFSTFLTTPGGQKLTELAGEVVSGIFGLLHIHLNAVTVKAESPK
jgi:hypothetical protein